MKKSDSLALRAVLAINVLLITALLVGWTTSKSSGTSHIFYDTAETGLGTFFFGKTHMSVGVYSGTGAMTLGIYSSNGNVSAGWDTVKTVGGYQWSGAQIDSLNVIALGSSQFIIEGTN